MTPCPLPFKPKWIGVKYFIYDHSTLKHWNSHKSVVMYTCTRALKHRKPVHGCEFLKWSKNMLTLKHWNSEILSKTDYRGTKVLKHWNYIRLSYQERSYCHGNRIFYTPENEAMAFGHWNIEILSFLLTFHESHIRHEAFSLPEYPHF